MDWEAFYNHFREPNFIPGYEIQNRLGGGAFGEVYKARKHSIGKAYAIKFLKIDDEAQRDAVERELEQVRHFAVIDHQNLVTIEDLGAAMGVPYLIMGYAGEDTLARRMKQGQLEPQHALSFFVQACRGVLALHDRRLVHFDLKPSNIFLKGDIARVGDYGLSKMMTDGRQTLSFGRGTPQYMAPEMLRNRADHRADIYSLGVILYECFANKNPFQSVVPGTLAIRDTDTPPAFPPEFPAQLRLVCERCLRLAPDDRYTSVGELLEDMGQTARPGDSVRFPPLPATKNVAAARTQAPPQAPGSSTTGTTSEARQTAAEIARGAVEVARGVWDGIRTASASRPDATTKMPQVPSAKSTPSKSPPANSPPPAKPTGSAPTQPGSSSRTDSPRADVPPNTDPSRTSASQSAPSPSSVSRSREQHSAEPQRAEPQRAEKPSAEQQSTEQQRTEQQSAEQQRAEQQRVDANDKTPSAMAFDLSTDAARNRAGPNKSTPSPTAAGDTTSSNTSASTAHSAPENPLEADTSAPHRAFPMPPPTAFAAFGSRADAGAPAKPRAWQNDPASDVMALHTLQSDALQAPLVAIAAGRTSIEAGRVHGGADVVHGGTMRGEWIHGGAVTIPVPPPVKGGWLGTLFSTFALSLEILLALGRGLGCWSSRVLVRGGSVAGSVAGSAGRGLLRTTGTLLSGVLRLVLFVFLLAVLGGLTTWIAYKVLS